METTRSVGFRSLALAAALAGLLASGCSNSDDNNNGGNNVEFNVQNLSGQVCDPSELGLPSVTISVGMQNTVSYAGGDFSLSSLGEFPTGTMTVEFDGTTDSGEQNVALGRQSIRSERLTPGSRWAAS